MSARGMGFVRAVVAVITLLAVQPAAAAPSVVDSIVLVTPAATRPAPPPLVGKGRQRVRRPPRARVAKQLRVEPRTLAFHVKRVARVMMLLAAGIGPAPPPPPLPEPQKVEQVAEDRSGSEED